MGTRADFYIGRGLEAIWLGSIAFDGYPDGINPKILKAKTEKTFRSAVRAFFESDEKQDEVTLPEDGWPWPWEDSRTTDYAYAFDGGQVWASNYGRAWFKANEEEPDTDEKAGYDDEGKADMFPNMKSRQNITLGRRSGLLIVTQKKE